MNQTSPVRQKGLMRSIKNHDEEKWHEVCKDLCYPAILQKFKQNADAQAALLNTGDKTLGEAAPFDLEWGIGMGLTHSGALNRELWSGKNHQGLMLMRARSELRGDFICPVFTPPIRRTDENEQNTETSMSSDTSTKSNEEITSDDTTNKD